MLQLLQPRLTVVGAGPGDPELITLKAIKALQEANVVLYDALANPSILSYAPATALKIYVGKRANRHAYTQEQINMLIVDFAYSHGHVVRLKGGDPFVFGRGSEEIAYAESFNISTAAVPGISSAIGVPGLAGIPVTHRGISESFWVITGTTQNKRLSEDLKAASSSSATVVVLMGLNRLEEIADLYKNQGKASLPVAVIQNGSLPTEKLVTGTVADIVAKVRAKKLESPAIIVLGEVVNLKKNTTSRIRNTLKWFHAN